MNFDQIFAAMYRQYRAEATIPSSTDDEYIVAISLANEAIHRWENYDNTYWKELFTTAQTNSTGGVLTITTGTKTYAAPTAMKEAGGFVRILDSNNNSVRIYSILEPQEAQFKVDDAQYAYFTGNVSSGFTLHLNPAPDSSVNGMKIDYVYYQKATDVATGSDTVQMSNPYFVVHRMLASRFRASRNPYYNVAKADAEDMLKIMQMDNNSGTWADPWKMQDNSGATWGQNWNGGRLL